MNLIASHRIELAAPFIFIVRTELQVFLKMKWFFIIYWCIGVYFHTEYFCTYSLFCIYLKKLIVLVTALNGKKWIWHVLLVLFNMFQFYSQLHRCFSYFALWGGGALTGASIPCYTIVCFWFSNPPNVNKTTSWSVDPLDLACFIDSSDL